MSIKNKATVTPRILILEGLWSDTAEVVEAAGGIPHEEAPWDSYACEEEILSGKYHGIILTGGSDINPKLYGEAPHEECYGIDNVRDAVELRALTLARDLKIPVLGICRGSQIMAAFRGGSLTQHIERHRGSEHRVYASPAGRTFRRAANSREMQVVSLHHQCIKDPGKGMRIAAHAADGTPEALESTDGLWLGVQFHPEVNGLKNGNSFAIFQWLIREAARYAGGRAPFVPFRVAKKKYGHASYAFAESQAREANEPIVPRALIEARAPSTRISRKAGDSAIPSMREMTHLIEESSDGWSSHLRGLQTCRRCGLLFDDIQDRIDHEVYVCEIEYDWKDSVQAYLADASVRVIEPPIDSDAWEMH